MVAGILSFFWDVPADDGRHSFVGAINIDCLYLIFSGKSLSCDSKMNETNACFVFTVSSAVGPRVIATKSPLHFSFIWSSVYRECRSRFDAFSLVEISSLNSCQSTRARKANTSDNAHLINVHLPWSIRFLSIRRVLDNSACISPASLNVQHMRMLSVLVVLSSESSSKIIRSVLSRKSRNRCDTCHINIKSVEMRLFKQTKEQVTCQKILSFKKTR